MTPESLQTRRILVTNLLALTDCPLRSIWLMALSFAAVEIVLIVLHFVVVAWASELGVQTADGYIGGFDLRDEATIAVWFSSFQLLLLGLVSIGLSWQDRVDAKRTSRVWMWKLAAVVFVAMAVDETAGLHEIFGKAMVMLLPQSPMTDRMWGMLPYALVLALVLGSVTVRLVSRPVFMLGVIAAGVCWVVGQAADQFSPYVSEVNIVIEEGLEMFGATVLLVTLAGLLTSMVSPRSRVEDS